MAEVIFGPNGPDTFSTDTDNDTLVRQVNGDPPVIAAFVRASGLRKSYAQTLSIAGPNGATIALQTSKPLDNDRAEQFVLVGRKRQPADWPRDTDAAHYRFERGNQVALTTTFTHQF
jgi:hypothetical protein